MLVAHGGGTPSAISQWGSGVDATVHPHWVSVPLRWYWEHCFNFRGGIFNDPVMFFMLTSAISAGSQCRWFLPCWTKFLLPMEYGFLFPPQLS